MTTGKSAQTCRECIVVELLEVLKQFEEININANLSLKLLDWHDGGSYRSLVDRLELHSSLAIVESKRSLI